MLQDLGSLVLALLTFAGAAGTLALSAACLAGALIGWKLKTARKVFVAGLFASVLYAVSLFATAIVSRDRVMLPRVTAQIAER
jgi:ABC-type uncharacterized transport system permease subunit